MMITKSVEQRFLDNPGYIEVDHFEDGGVWKWSGGPIAVVHDSHIQKVLELAADNALPWEIKIIGRSELYYYIRKGKSCTPWMERLMAP